MAHISARYAESLSAGLSHVGGHQKHLLERESLRLSYIDSNTGDPEACKMGLANQALATALMDWFANHDLASCKQHAYVAGKLDIMLYLRAPNTGISSPGAPFDSMLMPLLSDASALVAWVQNFDGIDLKRANRASTFEFRTHQAKLALRGDWNSLGERSERFLAEPPTRMSRYIPDNRFYLALARGDVRGMESALAELVKPKQIARRNEHEGYAGWFIVREAVTYAKIAWRHGYQVHVDTPWIPAEWLPVSPLPHYADPYPFMKEFDLRLSG